MSDKPDCSGRLGTPDGEVAAKASTFGALTPCLDSINMFPLCLARGGLCHAA